MFFTLWMLTGCQPEFKDDDKQQDEGVVLTDNDGDGFFSDEDCNDEDPNTYPGAAENDSTTDCMTDADGDGYGDNNPQSAATAGTDCDDSDANIHPGAQETPADGIDSDCNGNDD